MSDPNPLARLFCGEPSPGSLKDEVTPVLTGLNNLITSYYDFSVLFKADIESAQASYFLPVALRSLMESSAIALLARIDPLRVILSSKAQNSSSYNKAAPQPSGINWKTDIVGEPHQKKNHACANTSCKHNAIAHYVTIELSNFNSAVYKTTVGSNFGKQ